MAIETNPADALTAHQIIALGDEVHTLALDHAIVDGREDPAAWASHCRFAIQSMARGEREDLSTGSVFECAWLAQVGYADGPTNINEATVDARWTLAA